MSTDTELFKAVPGRYGVAVTRTGDMTVSCHLPLEPDKLASDGSARPAAVMMGVDMAAGLAAGMGVHPDATMTADTAVQFVSSARAGPLRIDARCIKPGRSQSLSEVTVVDEGADDAIVAVATANHGVMTPTSRPRPAGRPTFTNEIMALGIGDTISFPRPPDAGTGDLEQHFGLSVKNGEVRIPVDDRTRNPLGILHGGLTGLVLDAIALSVGFTRLDEVMIRFMRPVREGPGLASIVDDMTFDGRRLLRVEMRDESADRLAVLAHVVGR